MHVIFIYFLYSGKEDAVDTVTAETTHAGPKKPVYAELFKPTPPPASPKAKGTQEYAALVKLTFKKPGTLILITPRRLN
jgi:hypothetical protein